LFYQKQKPIFIGKRRLLGLKLKKQDIRYVRQVGLGFKTPRAAIEGTFVDDKCPFTGNVSIRGRIIITFITFCWPCYSGMCLIHSPGILRGTVVSAGKMKRTVVIRRNYLHYIQKYKRYEKRHSNFAAHCSPALDVKEGDTVTVGECR
jgi:small subunit ribosomal protein S11e